MSDVATTYRLWLAQINSDLVDAEIYLVVLRLSYEAFVIDVERSGRQGLKSFYPGSYFSVAEMGCLVSCIIAIRRVLDKDKDAISLPRILRRLDGELGEVSRCLGISQEEIRQVVIDCHSRMNDVAIYINFQSIADKMIAHNDRSHWARLHIGEAVGGIQLSDLEAIVRLARTALDDIGSVLKLEVQASQEFVDNVRDSTFEVFSTFYSARERFNRDLDQDIERQQYRQVFDTAYTKRMKTENP